MSIPNIAEEWGPYNVLHCTQALPLWMQDGKVISAFGALGMFSLLTVISRRYLNGLKDPDILPDLPNDVTLMTSSRIDRQACKFRKVATCRKLGVSSPPDFPSTLPRISTDAGGSEVESVVRNSGVNVYASGVPGRRIVFIHVARLGISAEYRAVAISFTWRFHRPDSSHLALDGNDAFTKQPIRLFNGLLPSILLDHAREHIGQGFVQRAGLVCINDIGWPAGCVLQHKGLGDPVDDFVGDDIQAVGKVVEGILVPIAEKDSVIGKYRIQVVVHRSIETSEVHETPEGHRGMAEDFREKFVYSAYSREKFVSNTLSLWKLRPYLCH